MTSRMLNGAQAAVALAALSLTMTACSSKQGDLRYVEPEKVGIPSLALVQMESAVLEGIKDGVAPGAVLNVGRQGKVIEHKAFGNSQLTPEPVDMSTDTIFDLASVSKVMGTATMATLLLEDGTYTLQTRVADIIPEFAQNEKGDVRILDLLTHQSGLKAYDNWREAENMRTETMSQSEALILRIASLEKSYPTGEQTNYSCLNFLTLARVNEVAAGESQQSFLTRRVWEPLGMKDTTYVLTDAQRARVAPTFAGEFPEGRQLGSTHDPLAYYYGSTMEHCPGNAGLFSTAADMARYCQMILNRGELDGVRVMKPETVDMMTSVHARLPNFRGADQEPRGSVTRGLGWQVHSGPPWAHPAAPEGSMIGHTGYTGTFIWLDKNTKSYVVLLANAVYSKDPPQMTGPRRGVTRALMEHTYGPFPSRSEVAWND